MTGVFFGLMICIASVPNDPCVFHTPEEGVGHVAFSRTLDARELLREVVAECEIVHGDGECSAFCFVSRGGDE